MGRARPRWAVVAAVLLGAAVAPAAELLDGEFGDIELGRRLIEPQRLPTIGELRRAVRQSEIRTVLMFAMSDGSDGHESCHLPIFSGDGRRLVFQRGDVRSESSKLLLFGSLDQARPKLLTDQPGTYDYMFRWAVNSPDSYAFARIHVGRQATQVYVSTGGKPPQKRTSGQSRHVLPALYGRTDGIWRLVYEAQGTVMHQAWDAHGPIEEDRKLAAGTTPRWSRDGSRLLLAYQRFGGDGGPGHEMVLRDLRTEQDRVLPAGEAGEVRSPCFSPQESHAAFYVRPGGRGKPWRIRVCPLLQEGPDRTLGQDVVVNADFNWEGPAWQADGRRIWFFSNRHQRQAYHPLVAADVRSGETVLVDYPQRCTTPNDLAINPATAVPEMAFVAHEGQPQELFVVFLNHY